jgi:hypothetical protein
MSPFECARRLLEPGATLAPVGTRMDLYFADPAFVPLLVQENYLNHRPAFINPPGAASTPAAAAYPLPTNTHRPARSNNLACRPPLRPSLRQP